MTISQYQHWRLDVDADQITWLYFDKKDQAVNAFSAAVLEEFSAIIDTVNSSQTKGLVITSAKKTGFIAGADITQFESLASEEAAFNLIRDGQLVFDKLEAMTIPTLALINGFCLGGGYEMSLACRYRIALDDKKTKIGLPEIKLGIQPGWGGTVRLPILIGAIKAMQIILPGAAVSAKRAYKMGMVDAAVPERQLHRSAAYYILNQPAAHKPSFIENLTNSALARPILAKQFRKQLAAKNVSATHYPAPFAVIDCWQKDFGSADAMINEAKSISKLMITPTARNLLRVFFLQNKMKELATGVKFDCKRVHVIGAGTMGGDIAAWCALRGMKVTLQDQSAERIAPAMKRAYKLFKKKLKKSSIVQLTMDNLIPDVKGLGVKSADVIIEAVFENLEVKQQIFKKVESQAKPTAILATNTSSIPLEEIGSVLTNPSRLIGIHFFNPVAKMPLVEIVKTQSTSEELIKRAALFVKKIARSPLPVMSSPGFLVNRVLMPYLMEAMTLFEEGVDIGLIDKSAVDFGMPMGPVELADKVGLDVCLSVAQNLTAHFGGAVPKKLSGMVEKGNLGLKSGKGFYDYQKGKKVKPTTSNAVSRDSNITERLILVMLNEAVACLHEGVVSDQDLLDIGMIFGTGFAPFRGGPIQYARDRGVKNVVIKLEQLSQECGARFKPKAGWNLLLDQNGSAAPHPETIES
jgi:3-hydroxyacyl-CoA dehydrogenase / enoyl-CoA hydratase / 3-hydroxybutyryl-CoA epimerase